MGLEVRKKAAPGGLRGQRLPPPRAKRAPDDVLAGRARRLLPSPFSNSAPSARRRSGCLVGFNSEGREQ